MRAYHQLLAHDALRETRVVLDFSGGSQLTTSGGTVGHEAFVKNGYQTSVSMFAVICTRFASCRSVGRVVATYASTRHAKGTQRPCGQQGPIQ